MSVGHQACAGMSRMIPTQVWQLTLAAVMHTLATKGWAAPDTEMGKLLHYFGNHIFGV